MHKLLMISTLCLLFSTIGCEAEILMADDNNSAQYTMPEEGAPHEGTWLQWPHQYQYGKTYRNRLDNTWVEMCKQLVSGENVHIIAYDEAEKTRITKLLEQAKVPMQHIDFYILPTDDVWVRDNVPIFVKDQKGATVIEDWGFNGWGKKADYASCDKIPSEVGKLKQIPVVNLNKKMINEGGAVELDGNGTLMATKSAILNSNRNPGMTQKEAEALFSQYLGVKHFIWLEGVPGLEITDMHIDGFARFGNKHTIVTMSPKDLLYWQVTQQDINTLYAARDAQGKPYTFVTLPLTKNDVTTEYGKNLGYKGSYVNYYLANGKVLVPTYNDPNDAVAIAKLQQLYPDRKVVGIDVRNLYENGGMIHCVTQQQPL